jgi:hypothetical protein
LDVNFTKYIENWHTACYTETVGAMMYRENFNNAQSETYWSLPRIFGMALATLVVLYALGFVATGGELAIYRFWAPQQEAARRQVFENTTSYVQGKISFIARMRAEYETADSNHRAALRTIILTEASTVDPQLLPPDQRQFVQKLKENW